MKVQVVQMDDKKRKKLKLGKIETDNLEQEEEEDIELT